MPGCFRTLSVSYLWIVLIFCCNAHYSNAQSTSTLAIGFDLTDYYGTSSLYISPGHSVPLVRVEGNGEYVAMIKRFSLDSYRHSALVNHRIEKNLLIIDREPYEYWHDPGMGFNDIPRKGLRAFRKLIGLPASHDAGTISEMLTALKQQSEIALLSEHVRKQLSSFPNIEITSIVLSSPELNAFYDEDIIDAAEFAGLSLLFTEWYARQPKHINAYWNSYHAEDVEDRHSIREDRAILLAHLTRNGLELSEKVKSTNRTCKVGWAQRTGWFSSELGASPDIDEDQALMRNWTAQVKDLVQNCSRLGHRNRYGYDRNTTDVVFGGESGMNSLFRRVVLDAVKDSQPNAPAVTVWPAFLQRSLNSPQSNLVVEDNDSWINQTVQDMEFAGSNGAASMAWDMLHRTLPTNLTSSECWLEDRGEMAGPWIPYYGVGFYRYLAELWIDGGWAVWRKACCMFVPGCPLPSC